MLYGLGGKCVTNLEPCSNIRFLTKSSRCAADTYGILTHCLVFEYLYDKKDFDEQGNWHDHPKSSQSTIMKSDENIERVWNLVGSDHHVVIRTMNNVRVWPKMWTCERCVRVVTMAKILAHNHEKKREIFADLAEGIEKLPKCLNSVISGDNPCYSAMILELKKTKPPVNSRLFSVTKEIRQGCHACMWRQCRMCFLTLKVLYTMNIFQWGIWLTSNLVRCSGAFDIHVTVHHVNSYNKLNKQPPDHHTFLSFLSYFEIFSEVIFGSSVYMHLYITSLHAPHGQNEFLE